MDKDILFNFIYTTGNKKIKLHLSQERILTICLNFGVSSKIKRPDLWWPRGAIVKFKNKN